MQRRKFYSITSSASARTAWARFVLRFDSGATMARPPLLAGAKNELDRSKIFRSNVSTFRGSMGEASS